MYFMKGEQMESYRSPCNNEAEMNKLPSLTNPHFINGAKGYQMTFENGYCISVQYGPGNYCERQNAAYDAPDKALKNNENWRSETAEVAIFNPDGTFDGDVQGWLSTDEVAKLIRKVQKRKRPQLQGG